MSMTISIDDELKNEFTEICNEIGMSASTAFNIFAKRVVREKRIPFELTSVTETERDFEREARYYEEKLAHLAQTAYEEAQQGRIFTREDVAAARNEVRVEA